METLRLVGAWNAVFLARAAGLSAHDFPDHPQGFVRDTVVIVRALGLERVGKRRTGPVQYAAVPRGCSFGNEPRTVVTRVVLRIGRAEWPPVLLTQRTVSPGLT